MNGHRSRSRAARLVSVVTSLTVALVLVWTGVASAGYPASIKTTVPAGGTGGSISPGVPSTAKQGTIAANPATADDIPPFEELAVILKTFAPSPGARFLACVMLATSSKNLVNKSEDFTLSASNLVALFLKACIEVVLDLETSTSTKTVAFSPT